MLFTIFRKFFRQISLILETCLNEMLNKINFSANFPSVIKVMFPTNKHANERLHPPLIT